MPIDAYILLSRSVLWPQWTFLKIFVLWSALGLWSSWTLGLLFWDFFFGGGRGMRLFELWAPLWHSAFQLCNCVRCQENTMFCVQKVPKGLAPKARVKAWENCYYFTSLNTNRFCHEILPYLAKIHGTDQLVLVRILVNFCLKTQFVKSRWDGSLYSTGMQLAGSSITVLTKTNRLPKLLWSPKFVSPNMKKLGISQF
jgi:hypothetical protein